MKYKNHFKMITIPFNKLNLNLSDISINAHQKFANFLFEEMSKPHKNKNFDINSTEIELFKENKGKTLQIKVIDWFSRLSAEERIKVSTIKSKWLIDALFQMYLFFKKNSNISFKPNDEMIIFFRNKNRMNSNNLNSLYSFNLLNDNKFSSNDEIQYNKEREDKENNSINQDIYEDSYFKPCKNNEIKELGIEKDFLKYMNILSLNDKEEYDIITIDIKLLSDIDEFKRYLKLFTNDNYFQDWIIPFENKSGVKNFYLPSWMEKNNLNFSFCEIIVAFIEQNLLLNYEYYYFTKNIYELPNNKLI